MPEGDAFEGAYGRLAATRIAAGPPQPAPAVPPGDTSPSSVRWAASRLLPRLTALTPKRRTRRRRRDD